MQDARKVQVIPDRGEAISWVLSQKQNDDYVLIAGKGHESYQEVQGEKIPFNDRVYVEESWSYTERKT
jgi:UDP-N-acetylmuramoyl-L-alanyl-D-glutamate--2,6-diaminopimelate ligase